MLRRHDACHAHVVYVLRRIAPSPRQRELSPALPVHPRGSRGLDPGGAASAGGGGGAGAAGENRNAQGNILIVSEDLNSAIPNAANHGTITFDWAMPVRVNSVHLLDVEQTGNTIDLFADDKALRKQIMRIVTAPIPVEDPKDPDACNVYKIFRLFLDKQGDAALRRRYEAGGLAFGDVKQELFETVRDYFAPQAEYRKDLLANPDGIRQTLARGAEKARWAASKTLRKVRKKTGLTY